MQIYAQPNIWPSTSLRNHPRTYQALDSFIVWNVPSGSRGITVCYSTERARITRGGQSAGFDNLGYSKTEPCAHDCRLRALRDEPYTQKEAEAAIGLMTDNGPQKSSGLESLEKQTAALDSEISGTG